MKNLFSAATFIVVLALTFNASASGSAPPQTRDSAKRTIKRDMQMKAEDALEQMRMAYTENNLDHFFGNVSESPSLNHTDLKFRAAKSFKDFNQTELRITVDHALTENDKVFLKTHWQKRAVSRSSGSSQTSSGDAGFTFKIEENDAKLIQISGDSPF